MKERIEKPYFIKNEFVYYIKILPKEHKDRVGENIFKIPIR